MTLFNLLWKKNLSKYYDEDLKQLIKNFEQYAYFLYEKVKIIADVKNQYHTIKKSDVIAYIHEDKKHFIKEKHIDKYNTTYEKRKIYDKYKRWTNIRLKRMKKILNLDIKKAHKLLEIDDDASKIARKLSEKYAELFSTHAVDDLGKMHDIFSLLGSVIEGQITYIGKTYPIKDWTIEIHKDLFPELYMKYVVNEIKIIFNVDVNTIDYNSLLSIVVNNLQRHNLPTESNLKMLLDEENKFYENKKRLEPVICYHGRPRAIQEQNPHLFPLNTGSKSAGFFIDTHKKETLKHIAEIYGLKQTDVVLYEILIPKFIFEKAIDDTHDDYFLKTQIPNAFIFRPTDFPLLNLYVKKGIITYKMTT